MASDPERLARFEREARVLAALNHPNIATIYGVEESSDMGAGFSRLGGALVLELVEGKRWPSGSGDLKVCGYRLAVAGGLQASPSPRPSPSPRRSATVTGMFLATLFETTGNIWMTTI